MRSWPRLTTEIAQPGEELKELGARARLWARRWRRLDVAKVIELWTGIPASRVQENELKKLADLEEVLKQQIIGQDEAVNSDFGGDPPQPGADQSPASGRRPLSFVGPTGVGKDRAGEGAVPGAV